MDGGLGHEHHHADYGAWAHDHHLHNEANGLQADAASKADAWRHDDEVGAATLHHMHRVSGDYTHDHVSLVMGPSQDDDGGASQPRGGLRVLSHAVGYAADHLGVRGLVVQANEEHTRDGGRGMPAHLKQVMTSGPAS